MDKRYWVGFNLIKGIGAERLRALLGHFGDLELAWSAPVDAFQAAGLSPKLTEHVARVRTIVDLEKYMVCQVGSNKYITAREEQAEYRTQG